MAEKNGEIIGGLVQSWDPKMYELPPVPDWAVQAVPGEGGGESPVLYSDALADLSVRKALIAVGDTQIRSNGNGSGDVTTFDLAVLNEDELGELIEGAEAIRDEKSLPPEIRRPVLDFLKTAKNQDNGNGNGQTSQPYEPRSAKRVSKKQEQIKEREERQKSHEAQRENERQKLKTWRKENPPAGTDHLLEVEELYTTTVKPDGEIVVLETDEAAEKISKFVKFVAENPQFLRTEMEDSWHLVNAAANMGAGIVDKVLKQAAHKAFLEWTDLAYEDPAKIRDVLPQWLQVFSELGETYKQSARYDRFNVLLYRPEYDMDEGDNPDNTDEAVHNYGTQILRTSLIRAAHTRPDEFLDLAYDMASAAIETGDEFVTQSIMRLLSRISLHYPTANLMVVSTALVEDESHLSRLRSVDLRKAMEVAGCNIYPVTCNNVKKTKRPPKKLRKRFDRYEIIARQLGLDPSKQESVNIVFNEHLETLADEIESGGLPDSLYLKLREREAILPQNA